MNTQEILEKFVAKTDECLHLKKPFRKNGFLYATNSHILVRMTDDPAVEVSEDTLFPKNTDALLEKYDFDPGLFSPLEFDRATIMPACLACNGTGQVGKCPSCDGKGEFEHYGDTYDCQYCYNQGYVNGNETPCIECDGCGNNGAVSVTASGMTFQLRYLQILDSLPGIKFAHEGDITIAARFIFDGGIGLLMPYRK